MYCLLKKVVNLGFMKRILSLCLLLSVLFPASYAQIASKNELKKTDTSTHNLHSVALSKSSLTANNSVTLNDDCYDLVAIQKPRNIVLSINLDGKEMKLELEKYELFSRDALVQFSSGENAKIINVVTYRGIVQDYESSTVNLCTGENQFSLFISTADQQFEIHKDATSSQLRLTIATNQALHECHTEDNVSMADHRGERNSYADCLELYVECDFSAYQSNGSSTTNTQTWLTNIFSNVATLYNNYKVPIIISQVYIWNTTDIYTSATSVTAMRTAFVNRLISIGLSGKVAYLLSTKDLPGGISYGIGGFCNPITSYPGPAALSSGLSTSVVNYPNYSYNIQNVAHELGHVLGLRHTHACVWNGDNSQIDDCGNVIAYNNDQTPEGNNCFNSGAPTLPGSNGTIMSQCNGLAGQSINFSVGFGPVAGKQLFLNFVNASCFTGVACGTLGPVNDECLDAIPLTLSQGCTARTFDNDYGTQSANTPGFSCVSQAYNTDVWFTAKVPSSGSLTIETTQVSGGFTDMVLQAYAGNCNSLTAIACDDNNGAGNHAQIILTGRTPGETITIRVTPKDIPATNDYGEFGICAYDASVPCHPDYPALVSFYNATNGASWTNKSGWVNYASNCNVCTWFGVVCNTSGRVTALNLGNNHLTGSLPAAMTGLTELTRLNLYSNTLSGNLPNFLDDFVLLDYVDLGNNSYSGTLPYSFGDIGNLRTLYLDNNDLTGTLPVFLTIPPIAVMWLNENNFNGCIPRVYDIFCTRGATLRLEGNPQLPGGGNYNDFCLNGYGGDNDGDGYCAVTQDCLDDDPNSYPGAPEICDGKDNDCDNSIDENIPDVVNTWIGTNGNWHQASNWSTGKIPQPCHQVVINPAAAYTISITNGNVAKASSVTIGATATLLIQNNAQLKIADKGEMSNAGDVLLYGVLDITNPINTSGIAFSNSGSMLINSSATLNISNSGSTGIYNAVGADFNNNGILTLLNNHAVNGLYGINNLGTFSNTGQITIENINGKEIRLAPGSMLENSDAGTIDLK